MRIKAPGGAEYVPRIRPARQTAHLAGITDLTHDIREFRFATDGPAAFLPGQYAMLDLPGVGTSRAYSLSNTAGDGREWHFQIRRVPHGQGTHVLFDKLKPGDEIAFTQPAVALLQLVGKYMFSGSGKPAGDDAATEAPADPAALPAPEGQTP